jgi:hypothetical protein
MKTENFRLFAANGNRKRKFVFLVVFFKRQTANNRRLLFSKCTHLLYGYGMPLKIRNPF